MIHNVSVQYPTSFSYTIGNAEDNSQQCSGAYLGNCYIATASHCAVENAKVTIGEFKLTPTPGCNLQEQSFKVTDWKKVYFHIPNNPDNDASSNGTDFAIAKVSIRGDDHFGTINPITTLVKIGDVLTAASFGTTGVNGLRSYRCAKTYHKVIGFSFDMGSADIDTAYDGHPYIVVEALDGNNKVFGGDSGGALIKDGKLVGTLFSHLPEYGDSISFVNNLFAFNHLMSKIYSNLDFIGIHNNIAADYIQGIVNLNNNSCTMDTTGTTLSFRFDKSIVDLNNVDGNKLTEGEKVDIAKICDFTIITSGCTNGVLKNGLDPKLEN